MDPTQNNGFDSSNGFGSAMPSGGVGGDALGGGVPGMSNGDALGGDVGEAQPMTLGGQMAMPGAQPMMTGGQPMMAGGQAMVPGGVGAPVSSGTGDIVLTDGNNKGRRDLIIGVGAFVVIVLLGVLGFVFLSSNNEQKAERVFSDLRYYLENGYGDNEEGDDELVYAVSIWDKDEGVISDYYSTLEEKKNAFLEMDSGLSEESLSEFDDLLKALNNLINYRYIENMLVSFYENDGFDAAQSYFARNIDCGLVNERIEPLCSAEELYYDGILGRFMAYYDNKCIRSGLFDGLCLDSSTGSDDLVTEMVERGDSAEYLFEKVRNGNWYRLLSDEIRRTNNELSEDLKSV